MRASSTILSAAVLVLCGCGGSSNGSSNNDVTGGGAADTVTLGIYGATTHYSDDAPGTSIIAYPSGPLTTVALTGAGVVVYVSIPAGQTGTVTGAFDAVIGGNHCVDGAVTMNVTAHGSARGSVVAGSFGPVSMTCPTGPTPQTVSASFSATRI